MIKNFDELYKFVKDRGPKTLIVASAGEYEIIESCKEAKEMGWIKPILVGNKERIMEARKNLDIQDMEIIDISPEEKAVQASVKMLSSGKGDILLKGMVSTSVFLREILNKEYGLRTGKILSHIAILDIPTREKLLFITDGGMNIKPDLKTKIDIIKNACGVAKCLGISKPKVGLLSAIELVNPDMPETIESAEISKMGERGEFGECEIDGPLAMDLLLDKNACKKKRVKSPVCGDVDIIIAPEIVTGNAVAKSLIYLAKAKAAGTIIGTSKPVVMLSRADDKETKMNSIALGLALI